MKKAFIFYLLIAIVFICCSLCVQESAGYLLATIFTIITIIFIVLNELI